MALTSNPDVDFYLCGFFQPREFMHLCLVSKRLCILIRSSPIYEELNRLKFDKHLHRFDSYEIIKYYYKCGMVNLISQYQLDHYRGAVLAARYGHLDLLKLIYQTDFLPLARYCVQNNNILLDAIIRASEYNHHHVLKWFEHIGVIDRWFMPRKLNGTIISPMLFQLESPMLFQLDSHIIEYASVTGDLVLLKLLKEHNGEGWMDKQWSNILLNVFTHGHFIILDWILNIAETELKPDHQWSCSLQLELSSDPEKIVPLLNWYWTNHHKFPIPLELRAKNICFIGRIDLLEQVRLFQPQCYHPNSFYMTTLADATQTSSSLELFQWLYAKLPEHFTNILITIAHIFADNNRIHLLDWLATTVPNLIDDDYIASSAIREGQLPLLRWFHRHHTIRIRYHTLDVGQAAFLGYVHVLIWLKEHDLLPPHLNKTIISNAIAGNQIYVLEWMSEYLLADQNDMAEYVHLAIRCGRLSMLTLFEEKGMIDDKLIKNVVLTNLCITDRFPIIQWLTMRNPQLNLLPTLSYAISANEWHIVQWILAKLPNRIGLSDADITVLDAYLDFRRQHNVKN